MIFLKKSYKKAITNSDKKIIEEMDEKLTFIMDITEQIAGNKFVFSDFLEFLDFLDLVKDFLEDWNRNKGLSETEEKKKIEHIVSQLDRLILENNKYYGSAGK